MQLVKGDLFTARCDFLLVTTNSYIRKDGRLVMGRGAAYQAKEMCIDLDKELGRLITSHKDYDPSASNYYGVLFTKPRLRNISMGAFQVKYHFREDANLGLIQFSTSALEQIAYAMPEHEFAMFYPFLISFQIM